MEKTLDFVMRDKRQVILDTALALFRSHGYRAIGVDRILFESGVAKMTLYKYFPSKDALIKSVLEALDKSFRDGLEAFVETFATPEERFGAVFVWHDRWFKSDSFNGCMFINAAAEFPEHGHLVRSTVARHKRHVQAFMASLLASRLEDGERDRLAAQLSLLLDGAIVSAQATGETDAARLAWRAAAILLKAAGIGIEVNPFPAEA
ncbi:MAG: TetR/AcrR family transcriptional regulator [Zoogloeaceae bacterium]|jgi:AcrR family transcriptional regulator|nr:TetR/AcrR family transcriptional regulator [Zoogloeaceae bacterium]